MALNNLISSPQTFLADLFLDTLSSVGTAFNMKQSGSGMNEAFSQILNNTISRATSSTNHSTVNTSRQATETIRKSAVEEFQDQAEALGVPLESVTIQKEDVGRLEKIMKDSGMTDSQVESVFEKLSEGPMTLDRVMAAVSSVKNANQTSLKLNEESLPLLGRFLQEVGIGPGEVKDILSSLKSGQRFSAEEFRELLVKNTDKNLKEIDFSKVDAGNLKDLMKSLGVKDSDLENFWSKLSSHNGKMSLEGLLSFMKSTDRPEALSTGDLDNIRQLLENSVMSKGLKVAPTFDRIVTLLQSMGDQDIDQKFLSGNPAIQALRGGAMAAQKVTEGTGVVGDGPTKADTGIARTQGADLKGQNGLSSGDYKASESGTTTKSQASGFSSRLSEQVAKQIADKMIYQTRNGTHQLRLNLVPAHLGRVTINMVVRDNTVHATIVTENPAVKEALEEHMGQLKNTLAQQGVELESFDVGYNGREKNTDQSGQNRRRFSGSGKSGSGDEPTAEGLSETLENTGGQRLVNRVI